MLFLVAGTTALSIIIPLLFIYICYADWKTWFKPDSRFKRSDKSSPSYGNPPEATPYHEVKQLVSQRALMHHHPGPTDYSTQKILPSNKPKKKLLKSRSTRLDYGSIVLNAADGTSASQAVKQAKKLNMDHQYMPFRSFLWCSVFVGFPLVFVGVVSSLKLMVLKFLQKRGRIEPKIFDRKELVGKLLLETSLAVYYIGKRKDEDDTVTGLFSFPDFPYVKNDSTFNVADLLSVEVDLSKKRMYSAKLDNVDLTPDEAIILLCYYIFSAHHVKIHALANWAVNMEPTQSEKNPFPARNSLVTTMFNYYGVSSFVSLFSIWKKLGLLSEDWNEQSLIDTFNRGLDNYFFAHPLIREVSQYSEFVDFIIKLRPYFMKEFAKVKDKYFPDCHGEAMFVGTIIHSLDHTLVGWHIEDPLWLDIYHPEYGKMAEVVRIARIGFTTDLPGILFHKRFKGSKHPFYEKIYKEAAKINEKLADKMDTCIIK
uniref:Uncharacterized protein n=1 Tax=Chaetoceros debilis TaxID=122233 RepID=A0A7S3PXN6_9STRA